jgi:hypothetical protein
VNGPLQVRSVLSEVQKTLHFLCCNIFAHCSFRCNPPKNKCMSFHVRGRTDKRRSFLFQTSGCHGSECEGDSYTFILPPYFANCDTTEVVSVEMYSRVPQYKTICSLLNKFINIFPYRPGRREDCFYTRTKTRKNTRLRNAAVTLSIFCL